MLIASYQNIYTAKCHRRVVMILSTDTIPGSTILSRSIDAQEENEMNCRLGGFGEDG
jgi:hypothetical protein